MFKTVTLKMVVKALLASSRSHQRAKSEIKADLSTATLAQPGQSPCQEQGMIKR